MIRLLQLILQWDLIDTESYIDLNGNDDYDDSEYLIERSNKPDQIVLIMIQMEIIL